MNRRLVVAALLSLPLAAAQAQVQAQAPAGHVDIFGQVAQPASISVEGLAALPAVEVQAVREGGGMSSYVGPLLWPILTEARLVDGAGRGAHLQHVLYARGADGYTVAVAIGELDPNFEGKPVVIAYKQDGALLPAPRMVIPGDRRAGRDVRQLVSVEVR